MQSAQNKERRVRRRPVREVAAYGAQPGVFCRSRLRARQYHMLVPEGSFTRASTMRGLPHFMAQQPWTNTF